MFWKNCEKFSYIKIHECQGAFLSFMLKQQTTYCLSNTLTVKVHLFLVWFNKTGHSSLIPSSAFAFVVPCLVCILYSEKNVKPLLVKLEYHYEPDKDSVIREIISKISWIWSLRIEKLGFELWSFELSDFSNTHLPVMW